MSRLNSVFEYENILERKLHLCATVLEDIASSGSYGLVFPKYDVLNLKILIKGKYWDKKWKIF